MLTVEAVICSPSPPPPLAGRIPHADRTRTALDPTVVSLICLVFAPPPPRLHTQ